MEIFLIDDSIIVCERLVELLTKISGISNVQYAHSFEEAKYALLKAELDLFVVDVCLGDGNGIDILKMIKNMYPHSKVVMLSNHSYFPYREVCLELGAEGFFDKSKEFQQFLDFCFQLVNFKEWNKGISI